MNDSDVIRIQQDIERLVVDEDSAFNIAMMLAGALSKIESPRVAILLTALRRGFSNRGAYDRGMWPVRPSSQAFLERLGYEQAEKLMATLQAWKPFVGPHRKDDDDRMEIDAEDDMVHAVFTSLLMGSVADMAVLLREVLVDNTVVVDPDVRFTFSDMMDVGGGPLDEDRVWSVGFHAVASVFFAAFKLPLPPISHELLGRLQLGAEEMVAISSRLDNV